MIIVDTSIWVDFLHAGDAVMAGLLAGGAVLMHPFIRGEISLGSLRNRQATLNSLDALPYAKVAQDHEVRALIEAHSLFGAGIGFVDVHLLATTLLAPGTRIWTRDRRLEAAAARLGVVARVVH